MVVQFFRWCYCYYTFSYQMIPYLSRASSSCCGSQLGYILVIFSKIETIGFCKNIFGTRARNHGCGVKLLYHTEWFWHLDSTQPLALWNPCPQTAAWDIAVLSHSMGGSCTNCILWEKYIMFNPHYISFVRYGFNMGNSWPCICCCLVIEPIWPCHISCGGYPSYIHEWWCEYLFICLKKSWSTSAIPTIIYSTTLCQFCLLLQWWS